MVNGEGDNDEGGRKVVAEAELFGAMK